MGYNDGLGWSDYLAAGLTALHPAFGAGYQMIDNAQAGNALRGIDAAKDYATLQDILSGTGAVLPDNRSKLHTAVADRLKALASPVASQAAGYLADPEFRGDTEALREFQARPEYWLDAGNQMTNPSVVDAIKGFATGARTQEAQAAIGAAAKANQANPFAALDPYYIGQLATNKADVDNLDKIANLGGKERSALAAVDFFKGVAQAAGQPDGEQAYNAFANVVAATPNLTKDSIDAGLNLMKQRFPEMKFEKIFTGKGEEQQTVGISPLTGEYMTVGEAGLPAAPKVMVKNYVKAYEDELGKLTAKDVEGTRNSAKAARKEIGQLNALESMLGDVETGKFTGTGVSLAQTAKSFGIDVDPKLSAKEAAAAITNQMALAMRNPAGGEGMPGAMSDKDREFLQQSIPSLTQSREGRQKLIQYRKALATRTIQESNMQEAYIKKYGRIDDNYYRQLNQWAQKNPIFGR